MLPVTGVNYPHQSIAVSLINTDCESEFSNDTKRTAVCDSTSRVRKYKQKNRRLLHSTLKLHGAGLAKAVVLVTAGELLRYQHWRVMRRRQNSRTDVYSSIESQSYGASPARLPMGSHSVTCHPTQVSAPRLNPSHAGRYSIYLPRRDGRLSLPCYTETQPPGVELATSRSRIQRPNH